MSSVTNNEKVTVAYFFSIGRKSIAFAFWSMAIDRVRSRKFTGISFSKLLGTGTGRTFTPSDADLTRWGMVVVIDKSRLEEFDRSAIVTRWRKRSTSEFRAVLAPLSSHGLWAKQNPFDFISEQNDPNSKIAAITRARIKWNKNLIFWKSTPPVVLDLHQSPGLITAIGIGEGWPNTISPIIQNSMYRSLRPRRRPPAAAQLPKMNSTSGHHANRRRSLVR